MIFWWRKITENKFLNLKEEHQEFYDSNYANRYEILRNVTEIKFLDYNLLEVEKSFHVEDYMINLDSSRTDVSFLALNEEYNVKSVLTHKFSIFLNDIKMDLTESSNKGLRLLNKLHRIESTNENLHKVQKVMQDLEKDNIRKLLNHRFKKIYKEFVKKEIFTKFQNTLLLKIQSRYSKYLKPLDNKSSYQEQEFYDYNKSINLIRYYIEKFRKKITKHNHIIFEIVTRLTHTMECLISVFDQGLIAIDLPKNLYDRNNNSQYFPYEVNHYTLTIKTKESYPKYLDYRKISKFRSFFTGESMKFLISCYIFDKSSSYYEITPPENTQFSSVKEDNTRKPKCNFMMETFKSKGKQESRLKFERGFNERLVIHIPRQSEYPDFGYRFSIKFKPYTMLQCWVFISFIMSIFYISYLVYLYSILDIINPLSNDFLVVKDMVDLAKYQAPWIYGLLIGNQLWLQRPKFLWKKSTILSIIILLLGIVWLILSVLKASIIFNMS